MPGGKSRIWIEAVQNSRDVNLGAVLRDLIARIVFVSPPLSGGLIVKSLMSVTWTTTPRSRLRHDIKACWQSSQSMIMHTIQVRAGEEVVHSVGMSRLMMQRRAHSLKKNRSRSRQQQSNAKQCIAASVDCVEEWILVRLGLKVCQSHLCEMFQNVEQIISLAVSLTKRRCSHLQVCGDIQDHGRP